MQFLFRESIRVVFSQIDSDGYLRADGPHHHSVIGEMHGMFSLKEHSFDLVRIG